MSQPERSRQPLDPSETAGAGSRPRWIRRLGYQVWRVGQAVSPACDGLRWVRCAVAVGLFPLLISFSLGLPGHQLASACLLSCFLLGCVVRDRWVRGIALISMTFLVHCVAAIGLSHVAPKGASDVMPGAHAYWEKQVAWIETGKDPEYEVMEWLPAHLQLFAGSTVYSMTSMGVLTFYQGFYEVDWMNYYNGRLMDRSQNRPLALAMGWHLWSICRGLGYLFLTFEAISLSLQLLSGVVLSSWTTRRWRWSIGIGLLISDGLLKYMMLEVVRWQLFSNLAG